MEILHIIKIILGILFILCCLTLPFLLISLAVSKKKLNNYINQINDSGTIIPVNDVAIFFDLSLAVYIFAITTEVKNNPIYNKFPVVIELENRITFLLKIVKLIVILFCAVIMLLITLLNWLDN